jgi:hypothetical protein
MDICTTYITHLIHKHTHSDEFFLPPRVRACVCVCVCVCLCDKEGYTRHAQNGNQKLKLKLKLNEDFKTTLHILCYYIQHQAKCLQQQQRPPPCAK